MGIYLGSKLPSSLTAPTLPIAKIKAILGDRLAHFWLADLAERRSGTFYWKDTITGVEMTSTQASATYQPEVVGSAGLPAVSLKGAGLRLNQALTFTTGYTFLFVMNLPVVSGVKSLLGAGDTAVDKMFLRKNNPTTSEIQMRNGPSTGPIAASGANYSPNGSYHATTAAWDSEAGQATFGVDGLTGTPVAYAQPVVNSATPILFAADTTTSQANPGGLVRAVLICNEDMTRGANAVDYGRLLRLIAAEYGIA